MKPRKNRNALPPSDSGDRLENLFLRDQIGSLDSLYEATIEPEGCQKHLLPALSQHPFDRRLDSRLN
jgi:hypothetical protein